MNFIKNKTIAVLISVILVLSMVATMVVLPDVNASTPPKTWPTVAFLSVSPNPIGVGQKADFIMWIDQVTPTAQGIYGDRFSGYTLNITKPDGTVDHLGPFNSDAISSVFTSYSPDVVGNYTAVFKFPAQIIQGVNPPPSWQGYNNPDRINDTYAESVSNTVTLVVTDTPVSNWPEAPLPTDYWTSPINALNRNWVQLAGDWLGGSATANSINYNSTGPETAHILWTRALGLGGIAGENNEASAYLTTTASSGRSSPLIVNGIVFLEDRTSVGKTWGWYAVDLYTGETLYYIGSDGPAYPSFASLLTFDSFSVHGSWAFLWSVSGSTWTALDPFTANTCFTISNVGSGTEIRDPDNGAILRYNIVDYGTPTNPNMYLQVWNSTLTCSPISATGDPRRPYQYSGTYDGRTGYSLNISIPAVQGSVFSVVENQYIIGGTKGDHYSSTNVPATLWMISLQPGNEGTLISNITYTSPLQVMAANQYYYYSSSYSANSMQGPWVYPEYNVFVYWEGATRQFWGFDLTTGQQIWGPTEPQDVWMSYGVDPTVYNGMLLSSRYSAQSPGGQITAYDIKTGEQLWKYLPGTVNFETFYSNVPTSISAIADGKIYTISQEHSPSMPLRRDATVTCLNATSGEVIWQIPNYMRAQLSLSRGYIISSNLYDSSWYCFGKGHSTTTVEASPKISMHGSSVLVEGTVTDESPGAPDTPAISDADQSAWMAYLYMQQSIPTGATGVSVSLDALDPNGNFVHIGDVTSDALGKYSYAFTPDVPGKYTILSSFAGSNSYGSSYAETAIVVSESAPTVAPTSAALQSAADMYFVPAVVGIIVAIVIGFVVLALLMLRKRP